MNLVDIYFLCSGLCYLLTGRQVRWLRHGVLRIGFGHQFRCLWLSRPAHRPSASFSIRRHSQLPDPAVDAVLLDAKCRPSGSLFHCGVSLGLYASRLDHTIARSRLIINTFIFQIYKLNLKIASYGVLFPDNQEAAFSNLRLWQSIGNIIAFSYSAFICVRIKLYILICLLIPGMVGYLAIEIRQRRGPVVHRPPN